MTDPEMDAAEKWLARSKELCRQCGHLFDPHRLCGYGDPPTEGWIECQVEGCDCRQTWSLEPGVAEQIRAINDERNGR